MKLADFDYQLPKELIAQYPLKERDSSRLLVLERGKGNIEHRNFKDIPDYLKKNDLLVLNDTKVLSCRLLGRRPTGGRAEFLLLNHLGGAKFRALLKPGRLKVGEKINLNGTRLSAEIISKNEVSFNTENLDAIYNLGVMPLPPYIKRETEDSDNCRYQTVYAKVSGAVAAPTAGLHFTQSLLAKIKKKGIDIAYVTLHVGLGTFKPVKHDDITQHKMEKEAFMISAEAVRKIRAAKEKGGRIFCVGTTSLRALESADDVITNSEFRTSNYRAFTDLYIYPGYNFKIADCLLTNFHLPRTTLFMLASAFAGEKLLKKAYQEAIQRKYRFYSYGDAMLII
jgi:S-adenosylmethionine:tRNA ribosyltransferase-isomerase